MLRWISSGFIFLALVSLAATTGFVLTENTGWSVIRLPYWLQGLFGGVALEIWSPALLVAWPVLVVCLFALALAWVRGFFRSHSDGRTIRSLEQELAAMRNLPFDRPAPLEDLRDSDLDGANEDDELSRREEAS